VKSSRKWLAHAPAAFAVSLLPGCRVPNAGSGDRRCKGPFAKVYESTEGAQLDKPHQAVPQATVDVIVFAQGDGAGQRVGARDTLRRPLPYEVPGLLRSYTFAGKTGPRVDIPRRSEP